jgi:hypothetical protein
MFYEVDWNCKMLPIPCDPTSNAQSTCRELASLHERFGFSKFLMTPTYLCERESVQAFCIRKNAMEREIRAFLPKSLRLKFASSVQLSRGISLEKGLEHLALTPNHYLPITLPMEAYGDWIDFELNQLLYKRHLRLMLQSFEYAMILYPKDVLEKLLRVPNAIYQFNYKGLLIPKVCDTVRTMLRKNAPVLLGSGIDHPQKVASYDLEDFQASALQNLSESEYQILLRNGRNFWSSI